MTIDSNGEPGRLHAGEHTHLAPGSPPYGQASTHESHRDMADLLSITCHELKTPLATIKGIVQLVERHLHTANTAQHSFRTDIELLQSVDHQVNRMHRLIGDLLDGSRIQAGKMAMHLQRCNLAEIVREIVAEQQFVLPHRSIQLTLAPDIVEVRADADRIRQVITNYLSNALKYAPDHQPIEVSLHLNTDNTGTMARISVRDHGPGLPPDQQALIWERFYQVDAIREQGGDIRGLGLGLYISKTIIDLHGGQVGVESQSGVGSTFWFSLPLAPQEGDLL